MKQVAYLFPGQGAQSVGMGQALAEAFPAARQTFEEADDVLGEALSRVIFSGPDDELRRTHVTQPALLAVSVAALRALHSEGAPDPSFVAGHSLGEYSALVAAGALAFRDALIAVRARGTFMQEAVPEGEGAMAAVLGLEAERIAAEVHAISDAASGAYVAVANYNGPAQTVIAGHRTGVERASAALKQAGARRVLPLPVSAPFHCALMSPVQPRLARVLETMTVSPPTVPIVTCVEARPQQDPVRLRDLLIEQVVSPVRFTEMGAWLLGQGITDFVEVGAGKTLIQILSRIDERPSYHHTGDPASLARCVAALG